MENDMVNVNAGVSESELRWYASMMKTVKKKMSQYSLELSNNWEGLEVCFYLHAISDLEKNIEWVISELNAIGEIISSTAYQLKLETEIKESDSDRRQDKHG